MKKILLIIVTLLTAIMATFALASCGGKGDCFESDKSGSETSIIGESEVKGIISACINEKGELILILTDGTPVNLGVVKIDKGDKDDIDGKDVFITSIKVNDKGEIVAVYNDDGITAVLGSIGSVQSGEMKDGKFVLTFIDGQIITCDVAAATDTVVSIKTVGNIVEIEYDDGHVDKIHVGSGAVACRHKNARYIEEVAHTMKTDGTFSNGVYLFLCDDCGYAYTFVGVVHSFEKIVGASSCANDGYTKKCTVCGYETNE